MKKAVILALLCFLLISCGQRIAMQGNVESTSTQSTVTWQEQYDLGMRYLTEGKYEEAIIAFTAAIEIDPKQAEAYIGRGDAYVSANDASNDEAAKKDYLYAIELDTQKPAPYGKLADLYLRQGENDKAIAILEKGFATTGDESLKERLDDLQNDYSRYLTGEPLKESELTLGGVPFYELSFDEAIGLLPEPDDLEQYIRMGGTRESYYQEHLNTYNHDYRGVEVREFSPNQLIDGAMYTSMIGIQQSIDKSTLTGLYYHGDFYNSFLRVPTEIRGIATKDTAEEVLVKLGFSEEGAIKLGELLNSGVIFIHVTDENHISIDCEIFEDDNMRHDIQFYFENCRVFFEFSGGLLNHVSCYR